MTKGLWSAARAAALAFLLVVAAAVPAAAKPSFPALTGRVVDQANLLSPDQEQALSAKLQALETQHSDQFVVVTVNSLEGYDIADYGVELGREWKIGQANANNGVLMVVAPNERKVRLEVGYGLESVLTDALSSQIIQQKILPRFRDNDYPGGINAGADAVIEQLSLDPAEAQARAAKAAQGGGDGADIDTIIFIIIMLLVVGPNVLVLMAVLGFFGKSGRRWARSSGSGWSGSSGGSSWSSGSSGGGFSGGGGSFGGGGSSGGW